MIRTSLVPCALVCVMASVEAQDGSAIFETLDGAERVLPVAELGPESLGDAAFLRFTDLVPPEPLDPVTVCEIKLSGGDLLLGKVEGLDAERLGLQPAGGKRLTIGVDDVLSLRFPARMRADEAPPVAPESGDRLYRLLPRGVDRVDGLLIGFSPQGVQFEGRVGERTYPWEDVAALFIEPLEDLAPPVTEGQTRVRVNLEDGGHLTASLQGISPAGVVLHNGREEVQLPLGLIAELLVLNDRYAFLGWLPVDAGPARAPFDPPGAEPLGMVWRHRIDRAVDGAALQAGGRSWTRGIGVHAPSRLTWKLAGKWGRLRTWAGLQDPKRAGRVRGSVQFRIFVDGKQVYESALARGGDATLRIPDIPLTDAQVLVLEVDDGGDGPVMDRANWLRPMLLR